MSANKNQISSHKNEQIKGSIPKVTSELASQMKVVKVFQDFDIYKQSDKVIRNSSSHKNELIHKLDISKHDIDTLSHQAKRGIREFTQQITYLKDMPVIGQFIAYCIVKKQSNSGLISHERLIVLDSHTKEVKYFSKIPNLPIKSMEEISEPKQSINMLKSKNFTCSTVRNTIGEIQVSWMEGNKLKKWNLKMGNNHIAKQFCKLSDSIKNNRYLQERAQTKNNRKPSLTLNNQTVEVSKVQLKKKQVNPTISKDINQQSSQITKKQQKRQQTISNESEPKLIIKKTESKEIIVSNNINQSISIEQNETPIIIKTQSAKDYQTKKLQIQESYKSIKIQDIVKQIYRQNQSNSAQNIQKSPFGKKHSEVLEQNIVILNDEQIDSINENQRRQKKENILIITQNAQSSLHDNTRLSQLDTILKNRRVFEPDEDQSISTIKNLQKQPQSLAMSKLLIAKMHRKLTNKQQLNTKKQKHLINQAQFYQSQKPQNLQKYRQNLLEQRRYTQNVNNLQKQRKTYILNQHNHPRQEKSRSRSKDKEQSKSNLIVQRQWLFKWISANDKNQRVQIYAKFIDHCNARVQKLTEGFQNWHLFHKDHQQYVIKQNNIEYTYQMLKSTQKDNSSILHEQEMFKKMQNLNYLWKIIHETKLNDQKVRIPLACIIIYKSLKIFCKVQLASDLLLIEQLQDMGPYADELKTIQQASKGTLRYCSVFQLTSNSSKWLYINDLDMLLKLNFQNNYAVGYQYIQKYVKDRKESSHQIILQQLNRNIIPSFLNHINQIQPLTTYDFQQLLKSYSLNHTLLPLIYRKSIQMKTIKATKWILSQLCCTFLQKQVRQGIHNYLMKKQVNKSLIKQLFTILTKAFRWNDDSSLLASRIKQSIGSELSQIKQWIIDQYIISSLLIKLSLNCCLKSIPHLSVLQKKDFSFWREFQFQPESIQLIFTTKLIAYDYRQLIDNKQIQQILKNIPCSTMSNTELLIMHQKLSKNYSSSFLYKVLPSQIKQKIQYLELFCNNIFKNQTSISLVGSRFPKLAKIKISYYLNIDSFKFAAQTINRLIKLKRYDQVQSLIRVELSRVWIWGKNCPNILIFLYDQYTKLSLQKREQADSLSSCLKSLQLALEFYQQKSISIGILMQKIFKVAQIHTIYNDFDQAINLYKASQEIYQNMIGQNGISDQLISRYMCIYYKYTSMLMSKGKTQDAIKEIKINLQKYNSWKQQLKHLKYQVLVRIHEQQFQSYLLMFRCYELLNKKLQLMHLIQQCSIKFIQNYIDLMLNKKKLDINYIPSKRYIEVVKNMWHGIILNCHSKNITYQQYFSKIYSNIKLIDLNNIQRVILAVQKQCQGNLPLQMKQAIQIISINLSQNMPKSQLQKISNLNMNSIFVEKCINCLTNLSSPNFVQTQSQEQQIKNSKSLEFLSCMISLMGYQYSLGCINGQQKSNQI